MRRAWFFYFLEEEEDCLILSNRLYHQSGLKSFETNKCSIHMCITEVAKREEGDQGTQQGSIYILTIMFLKSQWR